MLALWNAHGAGGMLLLADCLTDAVFPAVSALLQKRGR